MKGQYKIYEGRAVFLAGYGWKRIRVMTFQKFSWILRQ